MRKKKKSIQQRLVDMTVDKKAMKELKKKAAQKKIKKMNVEKEITDIKWQIDRLCTYTDTLCKHISTIGAELEKVKPKVESQPKKEYKRPRVEDGESFWVISPDGDVLEDIENNGCSSDICYAMGNYYLTEEEACCARDRQRVLQELKDLANELNNGSKITSNPHSMIRDYYYIAWDGTDFVLGETSNANTVGGVYCLSGEFLDVALERLGWSNLRKLFKEE